MDKVLVVAPHADDEVLGVGGTIAKLARLGHEVTVAIVTGHGEGAAHPLWPVEVWEVVRSEARKAHALLGVHETIFGELPAAMVADVPSHQVNAVIHDLLCAVAPDVLYVPFLSDLHLDHRAITYACSVAWRPVTEQGRNIRSVYMYETLSETHWNIQPQEPGFPPNAFSVLSEEDLDKKKQALAMFDSQIRRFPDCRSVEAVESLARFRGSLVGHPAAEAFVVVRQIWRDA